MRKASGKYFLGVSSMSIKELPICVENGRMMLLTTINGKRKTDTLQGKSSKIKAYEELTNLTTFAYLLILGLYKNKKAWY